MNMTPKGICEVLSNNKGYYKEVFDYCVFSKNKIRAFRQYKNPNYIKAKMTWREGISTSSPKLKYMSNIAIPNNILFALNPQTPY